MESAFRIQENPSDSLFEEFALVHDSEKHARFSERDMRNQREREEDRYGLVALSRFVSRAVDLMKRRWPAVA
jgi:hypothetical protein